MLVSTKRSAIPDLNSVWGAKCTRTETVSSWIRIIGIMAKVWTEWILVLENKKESCLGW